LKGLKLGILNLYAKNDKYLNRRTKGFNFPSRCNAKIKSEYD